jgi:tetraacyldisaccharide 4'-kinase
VIEVDMVFEDHLAPSLIIDRAIVACRERRLREMKVGVKAIPAKAEPL